VKLWSLAVGALGVLSTVPVHADEAATDRALAEVLFRDARDLMDHGQAAAACPKFAESYRLDQALGTLLNLAVCNEQVGQLASAWARYNEAITVARQKGDATRQQFAEEGSRRLEGHYATLGIVPAKELAAVADLTFVLDNRSLGRAIVDTPIPIDPGSHVLVVRASGYEPWSKSFEIAKGAGRVPLEVPALRAQGALPLAPPAAAAAAAAPPPPAAASSDPGSTQRIWGLVTGGAGVVGLGVSLGFGAHALSKKHDRDELCPAGACPTQDGIDAHHAANTAATIANVAGVAGGALLATGLVLYFTAPHASEHARAAAPRLSLGLGSVRWSGSWE